MPSLKTCSLEGCDFIFFKYIALSTLILLSVISDVKSFKIRNIILYPFMALGIGINIFLTGVNGLVSSIAGTLLPLICIFLFVLDMLGAGDIKLFSAIGSIMGIKFVLYTMACSFLSGGVIAILILIIRKNGRQRFTYFFNYLKACIFTRSILPYDTAANKQNYSTLHFAVAIACGAAISLFIGA